MTDRFEKFILGVIKADNLTDFADHGLAVDAAKGLLLTGRSRDEVALKLQEWNWDSWRAKAYKRVNLDPGPSHRSDREMEEGLKALKDTGTRLDGARANVITEAREHSKHCREATSLGCAVKDLEEAIREKRDRFA